MLEIALIAVAVVASTPAHGVPDAGDCKAPQTQADINACAGLEAATAQARLDRLYGRYRTRLRPEQKAMLAEAQRRWIASRASWCDFVASGVEGGSVQPAVISRCLAEVTAQRIKELERVASCKEGDPSCPQP